MLKAVTVALLIALAAGGAHADNKEAARASYIEGTRLYDLADFNAALEAFKKAYLNYEEPAFLFNIAQCYRSLGNKPEAVRFYRTFLRKVPQAPNRDEVLKIIANLEQQIAQDHASRVEPPTGMLPPATKPGEKPMAERIEKPAGERVAVERPVERQPVVERPVERPIVVEHPVERPIVVEHPVVERPVEVAPIDTAPQRTPVYRRWWLWTIVAAVVVVGVAVGVGVALSSSPAKFSPTLGEIGPGRALTVHF